MRGEFFEVSSLGGRETPRRMRVLVVGGSQGASILNRLVPGALARVDAAGVRFAAIHQTGRGRAADVAAAYGRHAFSVSAVLPVEFVEDMAQAYAEADLLVARAGAMTVAEIAASGRPAVLVPFAGATHGHQEANARALERDGAAVVLTEDESSEESLGNAIAALLSDPARLAAMGDAARRSARPDAAARLCDVVFEAEVSRI